LFPDRDHGGQKTDRVRMVGCQNPATNDFLLVSRSIWLLGYGRTTHGVTFNRMYLYGRFQLDWNIGSPYHGIMKTTIEIPDETFGTLLRLTRAKTKRDAILAAIEEYNRRHQVEALVATFGTWKMDSNEELESADMEDARRSR
jgi:hypothetical protein